MWRALFLAFGVFSFILGVESLLVEKAIMSNRGATNARGMTMPNMRSKDLVPPAWAPWSLMSAGAVVILYSFTLPEKLKT